MGTVELTWNAIRQKKKKNWAEKSSGTYRVGDDEDVGVRRSVSSGLGEVTDDGGVGVEEVYHKPSQFRLRWLGGTVGRHTVTGHAGLARNTGRDEDDLGALEGVLKAGAVGGVASDNAVGVDVAEISSDTYICQFSVLFARAS